MPTAQIKHFTDSRHTTLYHPHRTTSVECGGYMRDRMCTTLMYPPLQQSLTCSSDHFHHIMFLLFRNAMTDYDSDWFSYQLASMIID